MRELVVLNPGHVLYYQMEERFARQMAEYYRLSRDEERIPGYGIRLISEFTSQACRLFSAKEMSKLLKAGIQDLVVEPEQIYLWHRTSAHWSSYPMQCDNYTHLLSMFNGQDFWTRYKNQKPFREAWEKELVSERISVDVFYDNSVDQDVTVLSIVGQERLCLRAYLEMRLKVSPATISRAVKRLMENGWLSEKTVTEGPGRPTGLLFLTPEGLEKVNRLGIQAAPPDPDAEQAMAERIYHQRIAMSFLKAFNNAKLTRAYSDRKVNQVESPIGNIIPDLVIEIPGCDVVRVEAETGKYDFKRLRDKMDKYLASSLDSVCVIAETQTSPTWQHLNNWVVNRRREPLAGIASSSKLVIYFTTLDLLQRHGPQGNIWRTLSLKPENISTHQPFQLVSAPKTDLGTQIDLIKTVTDDLRVQWAKNFVPIPDANHRKFLLTVGQPVLMRDYVEGTEYARLDADWFVREFNYDEEEPCPGEACGGIFFDAVHFAFLLDPIWESDRIRKALEQMKEFLEAYQKHGVENGKNGTWLADLFGMFVLVDTTKASNDPRILAKRYSTWRRVVKEMMLDDSSYFPRIAVIHLEDLRKTRSHIEVTDYAYDLMGYC